MKPALQSKIENQFGSIEQFEKDVKWGYIAEEFLCKLLYENVITDTQADWLTNKRISVSDIFNGRYECVGNNEAKVMLIMDHCNAELEFKFFTH